MLTNQSVDKLKVLINNQDPSDKKELTEALDDICRLIGTQSLLIRNMRMELENQQVNAATINQMVEENTLNSLLSNLNPPKRNPFTMDQAKTASESLIEKVNNATDFAEILKGVVQVAKVFI